MKQISQRIISAIGSNIFLYLTIGWLAIQSAWIALSGLYPMAFDERFHFDLIRLYAERWHPFWANTPPGDAYFGPISRDPSYLYHYLMSFPYRIIELFTDNPKTQVIILRFTSIAFFLAGVWVFSRVLRRAGCSKALTNTVTLMFAATPMVSLLAAQVNYDNLMFLVLALSLVYLQKILGRAKAGQSLQAGQLLILAVLCMIGSLIKYAYLPILLAIVIILAWKLLRGKKHQVRQRTNEFWTSFKKMTKLSRIGLSIVFTLLFGLCLERYGVNLIKYQSPVPKCDQVLSVDQCLANPPWRRNYYTRRSKLSGELKPHDTRPLHYAVETWTSNTTYQLFYTIDGEAHGYQIGHAFRIPREASVVVFLFGSVLYLFKRRTMRRDFGFGTLLFVTALYIFTLIAQNYADFLYIGYPFGIQGRYLIPVLPLVYGAIGAAFVAALGKRAVAKSVIAVLAMVVIITQGGGAATYIVRSNESWYWPSPTVIKTNQQLRSLLRPLIWGP